MRGLGALASTNDEIETRERACRFAKGLPHCPLDAIAGHGITHRLGADGQAEPGTTQFVGHEVHCETGIGHTAATRVDRLELAGLEESLLTGKALPDGVRAGHGADPCKP